MICLPPQPLDPAESISLLQALTAVADPRRARGRRHSLQSSLLLAVGAVPAGARSYAAIPQWARCAEQAVSGCGPVPHATTFGRVLSAVDPVALQRALTGWVRARREGRRRRRPGDVRHLGQARTVVAVDGKTLRGARTSDGEQTKLLAVFAHADQLAITQIEVVGGDELAAFAPVLDTVPVLRGVVVTADALPCQRTHATYLRARGGHYLFTVKGNQPTLRRAWAWLPWAQAPALIERQVGHGRTESRSIKVLDLEGAPEAQLFPHGARAIKVVRRRRCSGRAKPSVETVYAITSLGHHDADPRLLAGWISSDWTIENCLHGVRDVTAGEDHSSVRTASGPQGMAALRNTAINLIRLRGGTNIAAA
ncbi:ISAs1 family transposase [Geodermatophilus siccatus]|uniref:ISAs1 family transposase n=1 Tax=Geodermatophilus siccatus TaxID=1137991 RepID=UPI001587B168|nr:ISAs1 family transposase [Geodermatophilus siccatus]